MIKHILIIFFILLLGSGSVLSNDWEVFDIRDKGWHEELDHQQYRSLAVATCNKKNKFTFFLKFHPKKKLISKDTNNIKIITTIKNKKFANVLISATSTLVYDFIESKKNFMVYDIDYKHNLISDRLKKKVKFYYF